MRPDPVSGNGGDLTKLPKWAREEIERLRSNLLHHQRRADEALASVGWSRRDGGLRHLLAPPGAVVRWWLGDDGEARDRWVDVRWDDDLGGLHISTHSEEVRLHPRAANLVLLSVRDRAADL